MQGKNVILITIDSLRADHVGCSPHNVQSGLTPHLDAFAQQGVVFTQAFAQGPYTTFSLPSLLTGRYPCRLKPIGRGLRFGQEAGVVVEGTPTLSEMLQAVGYNTAGFHSNPLVSRLFGFHKGFDVFYDDVLLAGSTLPTKWRFWVARLQRVFRTDPYLGAGELNAKVLQWLAGAREPFFLWVHYMDTHGPYLRRKVLKYVSRGERVWRKSVVTPAQVMPDEREILLRNYRKQISYLDAELGRLFGVFDREQLFDRSLVIVSADHGDEFFEHGGYSHSHKLYDELLHVPLIVRYPGADPCRHSEMTELIQILPAVLDYTGVKTPEGESLDSDSFLPALRGEAKPSKSFILSEAGLLAHEHLCIRTKEWKLILHEGSKRKELYDLSADPRETTDVAARRPEVVTNLVRELRAHLSGQHVSHSTGTGEDGEVTQLTEEEERIVENRLRDLGYL